MCFVCTVHRQIAQLLRVHMRYLSIQAHICALYGRCIRVDMHTNARIQAQQAYTCACTRLCMCIARYICGNTKYMNIIAYSRTICALCTSLYACLYICIYMLAYTYGYIYVRYMCATYACIHAYCTLYECYTRVIYHAHIRYSCATYLCIRIYMRVYTLIVR